ncbi:hypothetical protein ACOSQ4_015629 [Xanthoceras sorbifolium]
MSKFSSSLKFGVEKFDGKINFGLWQVQVKDVLIQYGLHKVLKEKSGPVLKYYGKGESSKGDSSKGDNWKKNNSRKKIFCWACGQSGHVKKNCQNGGAVCLVKTLNLSFEKDMYILIAYH